MADGEAKSIDAAVAAARHALEEGEWARFTAQERGAVIGRMCDLLHANLARLCWLESLNPGSDVETSLNVAQAVISILRYTAGDGGDVHPTNLHKAGVVAITAPCGLALYHLALQIGLALACGNTVVVKTDTEVPHSLLELSAAAYAAGLPASVLTILPGGGDLVATATALRNHSDLDKIVVLELHGRQVLELVSWTSNTCSNQHLDCHASASPVRNQAVLDLPCTPAPKVLGSASPAPKSPELQQDEYAAWLSEWGHLFRMSKKNQQRVDAFESVNNAPEGLSELDFFVSGLFKRLVVSPDNSKAYVEGLKLLEEAKVLSAQGIAALRADAALVYDGFKHRFPDLAKLLAAESSRYVHDFEELWELGQGSSGVVRLAKNKLDGHRYAVKIVDIPKQDSEESEGEFQERIRFIEREAKTLADLKHGNVVRYYQSWYESVDCAQFLGLRFTDNVNRFLLIQMEYCHEQLESLLDKGEQVDLKRRFLELAQGLGYVHSRNIIHRDLCPKNIFFTREGVLKIGDFGLAKHHGVGMRKNRSYSPSEETSSHTTEVGTEYYAAPEISELSRYDTKADIYSLGVVFFDLCMGKRIGSSREVYELFKKGQVPEAFKKLFPAQAELVSRMVSVDPTKRPSCSEIVETILSW